MPQTNYKPKRLVQDLLLLKTKSLAKWRLMAENWTGSMATGWPTSLRLRLPAQPAHPRSPAASGWWQRQLDKQGPHQVSIDQWGSVPGIQWRERNMDTSLPLCGIYTGVPLGPCEWEVIRNPWSKMMNIYHSVSFDRQQGSQEKLFLNMLRFIL